MKGNVSVLTVLGDDRSGIISKVTKELYQQGCNLEDVSMTILEGEFAMIMLVGLKNAKMKDDVKAKLSRLKKKTKLTFFWKDLKKAPVRGEKHTAKSESFLITVMGRDRTGIVYYVSQLLANERINITDLNSRILGKGKKCIYAMMLEIDLPRQKSPNKLRQKLQRLEKKLKVEIQLRPLERLMC